MLVARFSDAQQIRLGVVTGETVRPIIEQSGPSADRVASLGAASLAAGGHKETTLRFEDPIPLLQVELLVPIPLPRKIVCIGTNYRAHAAEHGVAVPAFPDVFAKFVTALTGPNQPIRVNPVDTTTDYEGELCVVIGQRVKGVGAEAALGAVAGYTVGNDVSARTWQLRVSQWVTGKSFDTFCPIGPWLATPDSVPDPQALGIRTEVNGKTVQEASTSEMVFGVAELVAYLSTVMTLEPGDLILTGTPEGVGFHRDPQVFLTSGDVVSVTIEGIGTLTNPVLGD